MELSGPLTRLRQAQDRQLPDIDVSSTKARLLAAAPSSTGETRAYGRRLLWLGVPAAALVILMAVVLWPRALTFEIEGQPGAPGQWVAAPANSSVSVRFSDGSRVALAPGARMRIGDIDDRGAELVVERGAVEAAIHPGRGTRWQLRLGPFGIAVTGTRFTARWQPEEDRLAIDLFEGGVVVTGPSIDGGLTMRPGQQLVVGGSEGDRDLRLRDRPRAAPPPDAPATSSSAPPSPEPTAPPSAAVTTPAASPSSRVASWQELADTRRHREALTVAKDLGLPELCQSLDVGELTLLADTARWAGDAPAARMALLSLRDRFGGAAGSRAAFLLGRLAFDSARDGAEAAGWFAIYLDEDASGTFAREAAGRLIEAHELAGNTEAARVAAEAYLKRYPQGPHGALARRVRQRGTP